MRFMPFVMFPLMLLSSVTQAQEALVLSESSDQNQKIKSARIRFFDNDSDPESMTLERSLFDAGVIRELQSAMDSLPDDPERSKLDISRANISARSVEVMYLYVNGDVRMVKEFGTITTNAMKSFVDDISKRIVKVSVEFDEGTNTSLSKSEPVVLADRNEIDQFNSFWEANRNSWSYDENQTGPSYSVSMAYGDDHGSVVKSWSPMGVQALKSFLASLHQEAVVVEQPLLYVDCCEPFSVVAEPVPTLAIPLPEYTPPACLQYAVPSANIEYSDANCCNGSTGDAPRRRRLKHVCPIRRNRR